MFEQKLELFRQGTEGFLGGVIIGIDGIPVEKSLASEVINLDSVATEYITLLKQGNQINIQENLGTLAEAIFYGERAIIIVREINSEYYFLAAFEPKTNLGMIRFKLSELANQLSAEFG